MARSMIFIKVRGNEQVDACHAKVLEVYGRDTTLRRLRLSAHSRMRMRRVPCGDGIVSKAH